MNIPREPNHENQPLLSDNSSHDNNIRLNIYDIEGDPTDDESTYENQNQTTPDNGYIPSCTLTIDTNIEKSENENVLNSARPSYSSAFPSPFEAESMLKFYGGPTSDELCVPSGEYEIDKDKFIDKINGNNEDPFTLETFKDLIYMYASKNKDFIIARIKTADPSANNKYFYSYYDAHHINKVLFKTQPELSLLHRMQAKNPLNNMIIVGDVHYFVIKKDYAKSIFKKVSETSSSSLNKNIIKEPVDLTSPLSLINHLNFNRSKEEILKSDLVDFYRTANLKGISSHDRHHTMPVYHVDDLASIAHRNLEKVIKVAGFPKLTKEKTYKRSQLKLIMKPEAFANDNIMKTTNEETCDSIAPKMRRKSDDYDYRKRKVIGRNYSYEVLNVVEVDEQETQINDGEEDENTVVFKAEFYATDDDFLMRRDVRTYFKENALEEKDSILFTLSTNPTTVTTNGDAVNAIQHPLLSFINYTFFDDTATNDTLNVFSSGIKWLLAAYFLFAFLLVKIWISTAVAIFIVLIGVIFMFFLYLLLL
ncbi:hypothetical protein BCR36DRAFT_582388 [Piromyces finnis]|uniref:Uncharacterized protein n=1 Tax=Piromyces finnis TaxID=1754191 RepID=A0A1Y1VCR6_9FUNG|nr:hypothetical protein BCR36DRAFT_582388 [Piromyces finnis]|eukprot:ORX52985.1 hypothetical protein BCR36DRAFT_582388 [Piromyces finnis]